MLISLKTLIDELECSEIQQFLHSFSCEQDKDIENFLHKKAIEFEQLSKSRTYLICDEEEINNGKFPDITIYGYISLALKVLTVSKSVSNKIRKEIDGFSAKIHGKVINDFPCYLIGQLSRNSNVSKDSIKGSELIAYAEDIIAVSVEAVGGRYIMIECKNNKKLIEFYQYNGFEEISNVPDSGQEMIQMIKRV